MRADTVVIGGGVIGVCAAYYLAEQGRGVTLLEKDGICAGCSYGNAGWIVPSHSIPLAAPGVWRKALRWMRDPTSPFYLKPRLDAALLGWLWRFRAACRESALRRGLAVLAELSAASMALYRELAATPGFDFSFETRGLLALYRDRATYEAGLAEARLLAEAGIASRSLDSAEACALEPAVRPGLAGAIHYPGDAHLIPFDFVHGLARRAEQRGASLHVGTEVLAFETHGQRITRVRTTRGDFEPEQVVLAAGSWSPRLAQDLRLSLPIQPAKGYSITFARPGRAPCIPLLFAEAKAAATPMGRTLRLAGTLELAGLDFSVNWRRVEAIRAAAGAYLADANNLDLLEIWRGLRPCTPDGLPVIGYSRRFNNLLLATGHGMLGISLGPVTGKLVAQLIAGQPPRVDVRDLSPDRFD
jgi:D-amino-acid dehydrogenase